MLSADQILLKTESLITVFERFLKASKLNYKYGRLIDSLKDEVTSPCVLAIAGKVKAGKSSLLNALLGVDLAMTGTSETTATINVFKAGTPVDSNLPILCHYLDGSQEWHAKSYLDKLQGTSEKALSETSKIDKLVFYIPDNPILNNITIVDTPGIGAQVGDNGDSHQIQTDAYFKLRERHKNETTSISHSADAVIYLFDTVPTELDKAFLDALHNGGAGLTAFNGVGVLSKIDRDFSMVNNVPKFKSEFEQQLFSIVPTSAAIFKYLPSLENAIYLKEKLKQGFESESALKQGLISEFAFLHPNLPKCKLSENERKHLLSFFKDADFQWSTFQIIADRLYHADEIEAELTKLREISGIDTLKMFISDHFFRRARLLRCHKILTELQSIVFSIIYSKEYIESERNSYLKKDCLSACATLPNSVQKIIIQLVEQNIPSIEEIRQTKSRISKIKEAIDELKVNLASLNNSIVVYQRILVDKNQFSHAELLELERLFSGKEINLDSLDRLKYWNAVYNCSVPNSIRQNAAAAAKTIYQNKLS